MEIKIKENLKKIQEKDKKNSRIQRLLVIFKAAIKIRWKNEIKFEKFEFFEEKNHWNFGEKFIKNSLFFASIWILIKYIILFWNVASSIVHIAYVSLSADVQFYKTFPPPQTPPIPCTVRFPQKHIVDCFLICCIFLIKVNKK